DRNVTGVQTCALPISLVLQWAQTQCISVADSRHLPVPTTQTDAVTNYLSGLYGQLVCMKRQFLLFWLFVRFLVGSIPHSSNICRSEERRVGRDSRNLS